MARSKGRTGRPYLRARSQVLKRSTICWLCGEDGADTVDHIVPVSLMTDPNDPRLNDPGNMRPAHRSCNSKRGNGTATQPLQVSGAWRT